ncbi:MAG: YdcF family protein [Acidobacteriota bacterium]
MSPFRKKYLKPLKRLLLRVFIIWLIVDVLIGVAVHLYGRQRQLQHAAVIIVLGTALNRDGSAGNALTRRSIHAATLWKAGYAPVILCTGGRTPGYSQSEAAACKEVLLKNGVAETALYLENHSRSTEENAIYSRQIMQARGWRDSLLVTDPFHMLRASWILDDHGITHYRAPVPGDQIATGWYVNRIGREVMALQWQALKELLRLSATSVPIG